MSAPSDQLRRECDVFSRFLVQEPANQYVEEKYLTAHRALSLLSEATRFDRILVGVAQTRPLAARVADGYASLFARQSLLRRKLVLLLAILETAPPYYRVVDRVGRLPRLLLVGGLAGRSLVSLFGVAIAALVLLPMQLLLGSRR